MESVLYTLRNKFSSYGYNEYKMNKFEEYDLYVKNKDFLISDNVITFTDTNGKLLALKPDVTLSIVKNTKLSGGVKKVFYSENVYRVSSKSNGYKEIPQMGLECIGNIDAYNVAEVITLAKESLEIISQNYVLDLSPIGIISDFINDFSVDNITKAQIYKCFNEKNAHELQSILDGFNVEKEKIALATELISLYGEVDCVLPKLKNLFSGKKQEKLVVEFETVISSLGDSVNGKIKIDCSSCENVKYYNDITFKGYIEGLPRAVLSGGRYDGLLKIMGKNFGAIGFAVYPDEFDRMFTEKKEYDVDVIVIYDNKTSISVVLDMVKNITDAGKTVTALKSVPENVTYKEIIRI